MTTYIENILIQSPLFKGFTKEEARKLLPLLNYQEKKYKKGSVIAIENDPITFFPVIISGEVNIMKNNHLGEAQILSKLTSGDIFGEVGAFSKVGKWPATATSNTEVQLLAFPIKKLLSLDEKHPLLKQQLFINIIEMLSLKTYSLNQKVGYLQLKSIQSKLAKFFLYYANHTGSLSFVLPFNRQEMADYLSISRPSMSREMAEMKMAGLIDYYKSSIKILNKKSLGISLIPRRLFKMGFFPGCFIEFFQLIPIKILSLLIISYLTIT